jgi:hypothetical protein
LNNFEKWNTYQRERFPLIAYSVLICTLVFAIAGVTHNYDFIAMGQTFVVALLMFFLLRVADEFKDYEDDCKYRSYRAVPRGLVSLKELGILGVIVLILQIGLVVFGSIQTIYALGAVLGYWVLMSVEFFVPKWLKAHATIYLLSHMMLMPMIAWLLLSMMGATVGDEQYVPFLVISFLNGIVLEIGRKIRQKEDEENGVDTYSALWGKTKAVMVFVLILFCVILVAQLIINSVFIIALLVLFAYIVHISAKFLQNSEVKGKKIDTLSAVWVLASYLLIGLEGVI